MHARDKFFASLRSLRETSSLTPPAEQGSAGVIDVGKRLNAQTAQRMQARFKQMVAQGRSKHVLDLSRLDALDSGGLAALVSTLRAVRESGGSVHIVAASDRVTQILELTALTRYFKVHPSVKAALASF